MINKHFTQHNILMISIEIYDKLFYFLYFIFCILFFVFYFLYFILDRVLFLIERILFFVEIFMSFLISARFDIIRFTFSRIREGNDV